MDLKYDPRAVSGCEAAITTTQGKPATNGECLLSLVRSPSQLSAFSITSESSAPNMVYQRRKVLKDPPASPCLHVPSNMPPDAINFVYERRKHQKSAFTNFSTVSVHMPSNGTCTSVIRSENPFVASVEKTRDSPEMLAAPGVSSTSAIICNKGLVLETTEAIDGRIVEYRGSDVKDKMNRTVELHSVDDSCSSSMLHMDIGSGALKTEIDDTDECSSSGMLVTEITGDDLLLSTKDLCVSILRSNGLLADFGIDRPGLSEENPPSCSGSSSSLSCNVCHLPGLAKDLLICDECEEAFHVPCCNGNVRGLPIDEWYCQSCFKKKHKLIKETMVRKSSIIRSEKCPVASEGDLSPIEFMLRDDEPYTTGVRVGKGFQAIVPEWSGPTVEDLDDVPQPMELDPSGHGYMHGLISSKLSSSNYIGNWLQCREVIVGMGEDVDGTICGKWRRAPLFEVQTDNWDCFSSIFWDPSHADCAVPQELETEEVLKQLKYIEMLRPRLAAKRRKLQMCRVNSSMVSAEDASNCTV
uniref:Histone acetyltransferase n=1 Tax=Opuntia streptacantha TaxID=393608 RepID=A0A7C9AU44_OPUST